MQRFELYDPRVDWLAASLAAIPLVWLFYGFDAAFVSLLLFFLIGALKPLINHAGSRMGAGMIAAGVVLLVSPGFRYLFYNGYCYDGAWSVAAGISRYQMPDLCARGLFSHLGQGLWVGPLRDLAMPLAGLALILGAWSDRPASHSSADSEYGEEEDPPQNPVLRSRHWAVLSFALLLWAGATTINYLAQQAALEAKAEAEQRQRDAEAAAAAEEAQRVAAEAAKAAAAKAAKEVKADWLIGNWVSVGGLSEAERRNLVYCETDNDLQIKPGNRFEWYEERGKFEIKEGKIRFYERVRQDYMDPDAPVESLEESSSPVERNGKYLMLDGETYARCKHS